MILRLAGNYEAHGKVSLKGRKTLKRLLRPQTFSRAVSSGISLGATNWLKKVSYILGYTNTHTHMPYMHAKDYGKQER